MLLPQPLCCRVAIVRLRCETKERLMDNICCCHGRLWLPSIEWPQCKYHAPAYDIVPCSSLLLSRHTIWIERGACWHQMMLSQPFCRRCCHCATRHFNIVCLHSIPHCLSSLSCDAGITRDMKWERSWTPDGREWSGTDHLCLGASPGKPLKRRSSLQPRCVAVWFLKGLTSLFVRWLCALPQVNMIVNDAILCLWSNLWKIVKLTGLSMILASYYGINLLKFARTMSAWAPYIWGDCTHCYILLVWKQDWDSR